MHRFSRYTQISNLMEIRRMVAELFRADGQADKQTHMTNLVDPFRNFAKGLNDI